jgi:enamine deaminase RidA (YjgF/YER057c/UK114 family)
MIYVAGQLARDPEDNCVGKGDMRLRYFGPALPTGTTVEVRRLAHPDFMIEIEAIAVIA